MKRRGFLQLLGLAPAVAIAPLTASEEFEAKAKALDVAEEEEHEELFCTSEHETEMASAMCFMACAFTSPYASDFDRKLNRVIVRGTKT